MKKKAILSLMSVISMVLWSGTVMAQKNTPRYIPLSCTDEARNAGLCSSSSSSVTVHTGDEGRVHPNGFIFFGPALTVTINNIGCRNINDGVEGPFQFFVLSLTVNPDTAEAQKFRVITFNMNCNTGGMNDFISLPTLADNTLWFTEPLEVTVALKQDVGIDILDILKGTD